MTDEEFLNLARECWAHCASDFGQYIAMKGEHCFTQIELLTLCREIERRTLERAAAPRVPERWKLVPVKMSNEMIDVYYSHTDMGGDLVSTSIDMIWPEIVAAAPEQKEKE